MTELVVVKPMEPEDYSACWRIWQRSGDSAVRSGEGESGVRRFLKHNPRLNWVAWQEGTIVGGVLAGSDGWRGYVHHLAVDQAFRRQGVAGALMVKVITTLEEMGIPQIEVTVPAHCSDGQLFFLGCNWTKQMETRHFVSALGWRVQGWSQR